MAVSMALALSAWAVVAWQQVTAPAREAREVPPDVLQGDESTGLGELALPQSEEPATLQERGVERDMPEKPFPGQRRPPCTKPRVELNGGCWLHVREVTPPCGDEFIEYKDKCYEPTLGIPRPSSSGRP